MTFHSSPPLAASPQIRYVDLPRDAVSVRRSGASLRRIAVVTIAAATLLVAAIGFANAAPIAPNRVTDDGRILGEFRLAPGNQQPPGYVLAPKAPSVPGDAGDQWRPSLVPLQGAVSVAIPKPDSVIFAPKPPGRVPAA